MDFVNWGVGDSINKRICRYVINEYLGQYLRTKIQVDQLQVHLWKGVGTVENVELDVEALNSLLEDYHAPIEVKEGFISKIVIYFPWTSMRTESVRLEVIGLELVVAMKRRQNPGFASMADSFFAEGMVNSMKIAEKCWVDDRSASDHPFDGVEALAKALETWFAKFKASFSNIRIRIEDELANGQGTIALELHLEKLSYSDVTVLQDVNGSASSADPFPDESGQSPSDGHSGLSPGLSAIAVKQLLLSGLSLHLDDDSTMFESQGSAVHPASINPFLSHGLKSTADASVSSNNEKASRLVQMAMCSNELKVTVKLKQAESLHGPKVSIEGFLGSLHFFLMPHQIKLLLEFASGLLAESESSDFSGSRGGAPCSRLMAHEDHERIQQQLLAKEKARCEAFRKEKERQWNRQADPWALPETSENTEVHPDVLFQSFASQRGEDNSATFVSCTSATATIPSAQPKAMESISLSDQHFHAGSAGSFQSFGSVDKADRSSYRTASHPSYGKSSSVDMEVNSFEEDARYSMHFGAVTVTVMESGLRGGGGSSCGSGSGGSSPLENPSKESAAELFFSKLSLLLKDYDGAFGSIPKDRLAVLCQSDHLRLLLSPFKVDCVIQKSMSCQSSSLDISIGSGELWECLYGDTLIVAEVSSGSEISPVSMSKLLTLTTPDDLHSRQSASVKVYVKNTDRLPGHSLSSAGSDFDLALPRTDVNIALGKVTAELNVTLIDRLNDLFQPTSPPSDQCSQSVKYSLYSSMNESSSMVYQTVLDDTPTSLSRRYNVAGQCSFLLAVVKFPKLDTFLQPPQYRQSLRDQKLDLEFSDISVTMRGSMTDKISKIELKFKEMQGFYWMAGSDKREHFISVQYSEPTQWPTFFVTLQPTAAIRSELEVTPTPELSPLTSLADEFIKKQPSPFSSKKVVYKDEELLMPGTVKEAREFEESVVARTVVHSCLPVVKVHLPSKRFLEDIYNRICVDLLLWEPHTAKSVDPQLFGSTSAKHAGRNLMTLASDFPVNPSVLEASDGEGLDENFDIGEDEAFLSARSHFYSPPERKKSPTKQEKAKQSSFTLNLIIKRGHVTLMTSAETPDDKLSSPEKLIHLSPPCRKYRSDSRQGEVLLNFSDLDLFTVTGYQGGTGPQYLSLHVDQFDVHHVGFVDPSAMNPPLSAVDLQPSASSILEPVISKVKSNDAREGSSPPMLSVAMKIATSENRQDSQIAVSVSEGLFCHQVLPPQQTLLTQIADFFALSDEEVPGYSPPTSVTELCLHATNCMVDYRPKYLQWKAAVRLGSCSVSSNIVYTSSQNVFRLIVNNAELYLSSGQPLDQQIDLKKNYICVGDLETFDVLLKTGSDPARPYTILEASNNRVNVRTCPDSCVALRDLLVYLACDADLDPSAAIALRNASTQSDAKSDETTESVDGGRTTGSLCESADRSMDGVLSDYGRHSDSSDDEDALIQSTPLTSNVSDLSSSMASHRDAHTDSLLSDFDVVDLPGRRKTGASEIVCNLGEEEEFEIVEEHFSVPKGRSDLLNPPNGYPDSVVTYLLGEMTIAWSLYGGSDFSNESLPNKPSLRTARRTAKKTAVREVDWKRRGGLSRDEARLVELQLSKIRVRYDEYSSDNPSDKAFRLAAFVGSVEIRDRLASSKLDKFLYQYFSEARPRQSNSNMLTFKVVVNRPDPTTGDTDIRLHVGVLPVRLNVDQDALMFLHDFYMQVSSTVPAICVPESAKMSRSELEGSRDPRLNLKGPPGGELPAHLPAPAGSLVFTSFTFYPELPIRIDYHGKSVDLEQGAMAGLAKVFGLLGVKDTEIVLKRLSCKTGLQGISGLVDFAASEWQSDVMAQWTEVVGGLGPLSSLKQLARGIVDLFWLPVEQYRKDGRIVHGLQKGASSFGTSTAMATVELLNRLLQTVKSAAEVAHDFVSPDDQAEKRQSSSDQKKRYNRQPADIRDGVSKAYDTVTTGLAETATTIYKTAQKEGERSGYAGAVGGVLRHLPGAAVQPFILAAEATSEVLGGVRNHFNPDARKEAEEKWRSEQNV